MPTEPAIINIRQAATIAIRETARAAPGIYRAARAANLADAEPRVRQAVLASLDVRVVIESPLSLSVREVVGHPIGGRRREGIRATQRAVRAPLFAVFRNHFIRAIRFGPVPPNNEETKA
ncbi:MAG: hypothetical protein OXF96_07280 [Chloroflexi bacterium]|nr:hypothetical protein [Chloroflexota bacterium]